jgi:hypothetical protein
MINKANKKIVAFFEIRSFNLYFFNAKKNKINPKINISAYALFFQGAKVVFINVIKFTIKIPMNPL